MHAIDGRGRPGRWRNRVAGGVAGLLAFAAVPESIAQTPAPVQAMVDQPAVSRLAAPRTARSPLRMRAPTAPGDRLAGAGSGKATGKPKFTVGVFGDAFAFSIARGLDDGGPSQPTSVFDATSEANGLTQSSVADWTAALDAVVADTGRVDAAILMLGSADLRALTTDAGERQDRGSAAWRASYGDRVEQLAAVFRDRHIPLIWVGLPIVRDEEEASRFADLNALFRERAVKAGAIFVDAWEAFVDDNGQYSATGPDVNGQTVRLRRNDGAGFTRAGASKLASFVRLELQPLEDRVESSRRLAAVTSDDPDVFDEALQIDVNALIRREAGLSAAAPAGSTAGAIILLTAPPVAADGRLATLDAELTSSGAAPDATLLKGLTPAAKPGRADDFTWPKP